MATLQISNRFCKWISNKADPSLVHTFWQTSFNMPVKNLFANTSIYTQTEWPINWWWVTNSFDLTWFQEWWEMCAWVTVFTITWPFGWWVVNLSQIWKDVYWSVMFTNALPVTFPAMSNTWWANTMVSNQWVAEWEISENGTYSMEASASWAISWSQTFTFNVTNHPFTANQTPWMIWVEWITLRWVSANWHVHTVYWTSVWTPWTWTAWSFYIESSDNSIRWVWSNWSLYKSKYHFRQFQSFFSNWPNPWVVSWKTPWMIWMDENFWYEHIAYIWSDWYKWILPSWGNAYANPPLSETF